MKFLGELMQVEMMRRKRFTVTWILIFSLSFLTSLEASAAQKIGGKCLKKNQIVKTDKTKLICLTVKKSLIWQKYSEPKSKAPVFSPPPSSPPATPASPQSPIKLQNPVVKKINSMIGSLPTPIETTPPSVEWMATPEIKPQRLDSIKLQHQRLSASFPSLYLWDKPAQAFISSDASWVRSKMDEAGCQSGVLDVVRRLEIDKNQNGAGTSTCRGILTAYFLDRNMSDAMWSNILGSEFGGAIQENSYKKSPAFKSGDSNWYTNSANWYAEGSQTILSVIATAKVSKTWSHTGRSLERISPYCSDDVLNNPKCVNVIAEAAVELLVALYGWDAAIRWFENIDVTKKHETTFKETFNDPFELFQGWADSYFRFLAKGEPLPAQLLTRLSG